MWHSGGVICDPRDKSCTILLYTCHCDDTCQISLHLVYKFIRIFLKNFPFFGPFLGVGPLMSPGTLFAQTWISLFQGCFILNINAFRPLVCERNIFMIPQISPIVASVWAPKGTSLLICTPFNLHSPMMLPIKFGSNQFNGFDEWAF